MHRVALLAILLSQLSCGGVATKTVTNPEPPTLSESAYTHYLRGQLATFQGDHGQALKELRAAKREAPDQAPIARALVEALYSAGDRNAAEAEIAWAIENWPKDAQVWKLSGILHARARNFSAASIAFGKAIRLGANGEDTFLAKGHALVQIGKKQDAKKLYRKVIAREAGSAEGHYQLALLLRADDNNKAAARHAEQATTQAPYDPRAWALRANTLRAQGRHDEANDALRRPFDRSRGDPGIGEQLFVQLLDMGAREHALASVAILDRDDLPVDTRIGMGHWLLRAGDFNGALAVADRLQSDAPGTAAIAELRAKALQALDRGEEGIAQLATVARTDAAYPLMQSMIAQLLAEQGRANEAQVVVSNALEAHPDHPDLVMAEAAVAEALGDIERAREILGAAVARHPGAQRPRFALAEVETRRGRLRQAIATVEPLLRANPRSFTALNYIGYTLIADPSARERARDLLLRALELAPDSAFVLDSYGWFLLQCGKHEHAAPLIERAVRLAPTEPELVLHLAELRWLEGQRNEANLLLKQAESLALANHVKDAARAVRNRLARQIPPGQP